MTICNCNFTLCHQNSCVCPYLCDYYHHHQDDNDNNIQMSNKTNEAHIFSPDKRLSLSSLMMADSNQTSHQRQSKSFNDSIDINDQNHYQQQNSLMKFNSTFDHLQRKPFFSTDTCYNRIHKQQSSLPLPTLSSVISFDRKNLPSTTTTTMIIILSIITFVSGMSISFFSVTNFEKKSNSIIQLNDPSYLFNLKSIDQVKSSKNIYNQSINQIQSNRLIEFFLAIFSIFPTYLFPLYAWPI